MSNLMWQIESFLILVKPSNLGGLQFTGTISGFCSLPTPNRTMLDGFCSN